MQLADKIVLITGGSSGIGLATAKRFVVEGAYVFISGRRQAELDAAIAEIGENVAAIQGDISNSADLAKLFQIIRDEKGRLDVVFANAGLGEFLPLGEITEEHFDKTFSVNVKGTLFTVQGALPLMTNGGSIILTGSTSGNEGSPAFSVYGASKAAVRNFARNWILDLKGRNIRVNVLIPGATSTPGLHDLMPNQEMDRQFVDMLVSASPMGRMGRPEEIADAALFLASNSSSYVNGIELYVDGGMAQI